MDYLRKVARRVLRSQVKQAVNQATSGKQGKSGGGLLDSLTKSAVPGKRVSKDEALKILNFDPHKKVTRELLETRYKDYYEKNDPSNGGSYYIRSKIKNAYKALDKIVEGQAPEDTKPDATAANQEPSQTAPETADKEQKK